MIIFANILLDKQIITSKTFTALLLMAIASTILTVPVVYPKLQRMREIIFRSTGAESPPAGMPGEEQKTAASDQERAA